MAVNAKYSLGAHGCAPLLIALLFFVVSCTTNPIKSPVRIALLAPFEGRYREIGYNALYAIRLALASSDVELLPIDDGGNIEAAVSRAKALQKDNQVRVVIVLGYEATAPETQNAFGDLPVLVVGNWLAIPQTERIFILINSEISHLEPLSVTAAAQVTPPFTGTDVFALEGFRNLRNDYTGITIVSSSSLPDAAFIEQYLASDSFAVTPGLLTTTTYDAAHIALNSIHNTDGSRLAINQYLQNQSYAGITGMIEFENQYWKDAPIHYYHYNDAGELLHTDNIIK